MKSDFASLKLTNKEYANLLRSKEYAEYLLFNDKGTFINFKSLPKTHYLEINGDSINGLLFSQRLNEVKAPLIKLEV